MTNKTITPEILLVVANGVKPLDDGYNWSIYKRDDDSYVVSNNVRYWQEENLYSPEKPAQQLRIRDFLAEKDVYIVKIGTNYSARKFWDGDEIATSKNINDCAILAAYKIIKGGV